MKASVLACIINNDWASFLGLCHCDFKKTGNIFEIALPSDLTLLCKPTLSGVYTMALIALS